MDGILGALIGAFVAGSFLALVAAAFAVFGEAAGAVLLVLAVGAGIGYVVVASK